MEPLRTISACWEMGGETMVVNLLGNLALLAPLGIIWPWFWEGLKRWNLAGVTFAGFVVSAAIEGTQYACGHRMADVDDVLLNTLGAALGYGAIRGFAMARCVGARCVGLPIEETTVRGGIWLRS